MLKASHLSVWLIAKQSMHRHSPHKSLHHLKKFTKKSKFPASGLAIIKLQAVPFPFLYFGESEAGL